MSIAPPPGLDPGEEDLEGMRESAPTARYQVRITGLPNKLLTYEMMCCILEEAGVPDFLGLTTREGPRGGECVVGFAAAEHAQHCMAHFEGCQWDASGAVVTTSLEALLPWDDATSEDDFCAMGFDGADLDLALDEAHLNTIRQIHGEWARAGDLAAAFFGCPWAASRVAAEDGDPLAAALGGEGGAGAWRSEVVSSVPSSLSASAPVFIPSKALRSVVDVSDTLSDLSAKESAQGCDDDVDDEEAGREKAAAAAGLLLRKADKTTTTTTTTASSSAASTEVGEESSEVDEEVVGLLGLAAESPQVVQPPSAGALVAAAA